MQIDQELTTVPIDSLRPHPDNPNRGDRGAIKASMEINGWYGVLTVRPQPGEPGAYQIIAGEHRWLEAKDAGATEIPVAIRNLNDVEAIRIMLADNETAARGKRDLSVVSMLVEQLGSIEGTGLDMTDLAQFEDERAATAAVAEAAADDEEDFDREFGLVILCADEAEQERLYNEFTKRGLKIRVATI